jgi:hypothetical protein
VHVTNKRTHKKLKEHSATSQFTMMKVYSTTSLNPLKRPRCSIMPPPVWSIKRLRSEDEYDSEDDDDDDDDNDEDDSVVSLVSSDCTVDEDSDDEETYYPHSKVRFSTISSSATASHLRPPKSECWWNRQDRQEFVADCHDILDRSVNPAVAAHYKRVWDQAQQASSHPSSSSDFLKEATLCLPTRLRGLEWGLQSKQALRQTHVAKVLELQGKTRSLNPHFRERLLSTLSQKSSRPSRIMALLLGEGDATSLQEQTANTSMTAEASLNLQLNAACTESRVRGNHPDPRGET